MGRPPAPVRDPNPGLGCGLLLATVASDATNAGQATRGPDLSGRALSRPIARPASASCDRPPECLTFN
jgi:hypothetical protein